MSLETLEWENENISDRSRALCLGLGLPLGVFGAHRFYAGKIGTGVLQLMTMGGMGIWWLYDMILIAAGSFRDKENKRILRWQEVGFSAPDERNGAFAREVMDELYSLREEVAELSERVDFTERMLTNGRSEQAPR